MSTQTNTEQDKKFRDLINCACAFNETYDGKTWNNRFQRYEDCECIDKIPKFAALIEQKVVEYRDTISTVNRPLSAPPKIIKQPVPCPRCGVEEYADWTLYPHQLYNSYMPGGVGHYCFPCFAAIAALKQEKETHE